MSGATATAVDMTGATGVGNKENATRAHNGARSSGIPLKGNHVPNVDGYADLRYHTAVPGPPPSKPLNILTAMFRECLCTDGFRLHRQGGGMGPLFPGMVSEQFIKLEGVECIALGAVETEQTAKSRVTETVRVLSTRTKRLVSLGYLMDGDAKVPSSSPTAGSEGISEAELVLVKTGFPRVTQSLPLEVYEKNYPDDVERSLSRLQWSALQNLQHKNFQEALHDFEAILHEQQTHPRRNENEFLIGITVHNMAVVHLLAGQENEAVSLFKEAVRLKEASFGQNHPEVAESLDELGIQYFAQEKYEDALNVFHVAKKLRVAALGASHPKVAKVMNNIACVNFQMRNSVTALTTFQAAREIQKDAMGTSAKADLDLLHVATTLSNFAYMKLHLKNYDEARAIFEEALLIQQSVLGDNDKAIQDTLSNVDFANAFHS